MVTSSPDVVVLGGPNGAGKSTAAPRLLRGTLAVAEFVNADTLAQGLSAFRPEDVAIEAGRVTLERLDALERQGKSFAFESTLSSHGLVRRLQRLKASGYRVHIVNFFTVYLPLADGWRLYDATGLAGPLLVASGGLHGPTRVRRQQAWKMSSGEYGS